MASKSRGSVAKLNNKKFENDRSYAFIATFLSIIGFVIALIAWRKRSYVYFYAKQSLAVFVSIAILGFFAKILLFIPVAGGVINFAVTLFAIFLWVMSWVYALSGEMKETPFVGRFAKDFDF